MKIKILLFGIIAFATLNVKGQGSPDSGNAREKIKMLEIGYLTRQLQLTTEEAEKFWPLFNKYRREIRVVVLDDNITDDLERQQKVLDIRKKYRKDFSNVLGEERGKKVYEAEDRFKMMVRREVQQRAKARRNGVQQSEDFK
ncbi:MAG TPA: hypothetical protein VFV68_07000 [Agriterribacter sp.]|nr:hypothetical protein [Agriterribacter sp.]